MIFRASLAISCACGGIIGGWLGYMASDRNIPVRYYTNEVLNDPKPGGVLRVKSSVWRDKSCQTTVFRLIFDDDGHRYVVPDLNFPSGILPLGSDTFVVPIQISQEASDGPGIYRVVRRYRCNLLHWLFPIEDGPHDLNFTVAKP